jgi:adenosylhomocysteine nucleosidase
MRVAIFSAFPHEVRETIKCTGAKKTGTGCPFKVFQARYSSHDIAVVLTGMGSRNAESALRCVLETHAPEIVLSAGFGGALYDGARIGEIVIASRVFHVTEAVVDSLELQNGDMIERLSGKLPVRRGSIATLEAWKKKAELRKILSGDFPFPVCDMETFGLAKLSLQENLRFFAIRSISDRRDEEIPHELLGVSDESGRYRLGRALKLLLTNPRLIPDSIRLGMHARTAGKSLWQAVEYLLETW